MVSEGRAVGARQPRAPRGRKGKRIETALPKSVTSICFRSSAPPPHRPWGATFTQFPIGPQPLLLVVRFRLASWLAKFAMGFACALVTIICVFVRQMYSVFCCSTQVCIVYRDRPPTVRYSTSTVDTSGHNCKIFIGPGPLVVFSA